MFSKKLTLSDYFLIAANLLPIAGVWIWDWDPKEIFLVYCLETIIIGIFTLIKMAIAGIYQKGNDWYSGGKQTRQPAIIFMLFFLLHYGIFVAVQMGIFFGVSSIAKGTEINAFNFFVKWPSLLSIDSLILLGTFVVGYAARLVTDFILTKEYQTVSLIKLMIQPYGRIFIQQITVIFGSMFLVFGAGKIFITIFALVKIFVEVYLNFEILLNKKIKDAEDELRKE